MAQDLNYCLCGKKLIAHKKKVVRFVSRLIGQGVVKLSDAKMFNIECAPTCSWEGCREAAFTYTGDVYLCKTHIS